MVAINSDLKFDFDACIKFRIEISGLNLDVRSRLAALLRVNSESGSHEFILKFRIYKYLILLEEEKLMLARRTSLVRL